MIKFIIAITYVYPDRKERTGFYFISIPTRSISQERNNLFCVIIHFLIYVREQNAGLLDGVNLGRSGLNILGVIED